VRILVLSNLYPPAAVGGYERMCRDVVERWRARGNEIGVLTSRFGGPQAPEPGVDRSLGVYWTGEEIVCPPLLEQLRIERANQRALARALRAARPEVVSVWGMACLSMGLLSTLIRRRLPIAYVVGADWLVHGRWADTWTRRLDDGPRGAHGLARLLRVPGAPPPSALAASGAFLFVSEFTRRRAKDVAGMDIADAAVVAAGIDHTDFPPVEPEERPWRWRVLCVGRLEPTKGFDAAIRALVEIPPEATLTIVAAVGSYRDELERLTRELGVAARVRWDRCERGRLAGRYRDADVLVFPSTGPEAFGLVPLEAMACGTPVVATGAGGSAEYLVADENCLLVQPDRPDEIAAALWRLAADGELRGRLAAGGLETAARFGVDRQAATLEEAHLALARANIRS
jgi:glycosyltransferase involved in cell wall biosynthesis